MKAIDTSTFHPVQSFAEWLVSRFGVENVVYASQWVMLLAGQYLTYILAGLAFKGLFILVERGKRDV